MAIRRASLPAAPLTPEVAAIVLAGWGAKPPADAGPSDKSAFWQLAGGWGIGDAQPDDLFTVWSQHDVGIVRVWHRYRSWLEATAAQWGWMPDYRLKGRTDPVFFGEWCSAPWTERVQDEDEDDESDDAV